MAYITSQSDLYLFQCITFSNILPFPIYYLFQYITFSNILPFPVFYLFYFKEQFFQIIFCNFQTCGGFSL